MIGFRKTCLLSLCLLGLLLGRAGAVVSLFDFEDAAQVKTWRLGLPDQDKVIRTDKFATSGKYSMQFISPAFHGKMNPYPQLRAFVGVKDWSGFDRLVVDIANPSAECADFYMLVVKEGGAQTQRQIGLNKRGFTRTVMPLSEIPGDRSAIAEIVFYMVAPSDMRVCIDNISLLKAEEEAPAVPNSAGAQIAAMKMPAVREAIAKFETVKGSVDRLCADDAARSVAYSKLAPIGEKLQAMTAKLAAYSGSPDALYPLEPELEDLCHSRDRIESEMRFAADYAKLGKSDNGMLIGFASSMQKVLPKDMPFELAVSKKVDLSVARNEKESFQVAVMPKFGRLKNVKVRMSDLEGPNGAIFPSKNVNCDVVGFVKTNRPPYDADYAGWWPDPVLDFLPYTDIAPGDLQTFWVRFRAAKDQAPGLYRGKLRVSAQGKEPAEFDVSLKVRSFTMPDCTPMPTATSFYAPEMVNYFPNKLTGSNDGWQKMKFTYADFLADYYLEYDQLYLTYVPDFDVLKYMHDKGKLTTFNFGYFGEDSAKNITNFKPSYEKAKELGILDHAYIYGFDECADETFGTLEKSASALKKEYPEVPVITTAYDRSFGLDTAAKSVDGWCPLTPVYNVTPDQAVKARAAGKMVWWYIACNPRHPFANWWVEYPAIESRLLMGPMAIKYKPDGFLYYALALWWSNTPITSGPYTNWNPASWGAWNGDGSLMCAGPGGKPVPTIRLENYRDGMEDYAYAKILEEIIHRYEAKGKSLTSEQAKWLKQAKEAIQVPDKITKSLLEYTHNPQDVYGYRERVADLIDRSGMADVDPWGKDFGPWGFAKK